MKGFKLPQKFYVFLSKYLNMMILCLVIIILSILVYFLYNNFYLTLSAAKEVTSLQEKVLSENLQKEKFYKILDNIKKKQGNKKVNETTSTSSIGITTSSSPATTTATSTPLTTTTATSTKK